ncbi:unnamed protein product [Rotaria magnacalcarata]|uniref:EF-hand domain-containing protein n=1 Tax=Rotaria magnacalcarata TaxID=392030 RepID=A0A816NWD3_9BILA|nr:unnamed protein product [Rotaria magnacalcarata]CAF1617911.1 unnamed protein product [Rotaria magnacalcarata]CAF2041274.1 unnamed protein product [Rotaria magnacalcarata]CAF2057166.1 unnamed protein product [Rotaria magnacalcarata]CAF2165108.1 unnamed protein product [Rotaria magnacalcarata]
MSSILESAEKNALELNPVQLNSLISTTGMSEETILQMFDETRNKFPSGGLTEAQFLEMNNSESSDSNPKNNSLLHLVFNTLDQDHSGKIDIYEYILTVGLLSKQEPEVSMKCLFQLCDSNRDGFLTKDEIANLLSIFFLKFSDDKNAAERQENESLVKTCMDLVNKAFGDKTQVSEKEFRKHCAENEELQEMAQSIHAGLVMALAFSTLGFY